MIEEEPRIDTIMQTQLSPQGIKIKKLPNPETDPAAAEQLESWQKIMDKIEK